MVFSRWLKAAGLGTYLLLAPTSVGAVEPPQKPPVVERVPVAADDLESKCAVAPSVVRVPTQYSFRFGLMFHYFKFDADGVVEDIVRDLPIDIEDPTFNEDIKIPRLNVMTMGLEAALGIRTYHSSFSLLHEIGINVHVNLPGKADFDREGKAKDVQIPSVEDREEVDYGVTAQVDRMYSFGIHYRLSILWGTDRFRGGPIFHYSIGARFVKASASLWAKPTRQEVRDELDQRFTTHEIKIDLTMDGSGMYSVAGLGGMMEFYGWTFSTLATVSVDALVVNTTGTVDMGLMNQDVDLENDKVSVNPGVFGVLAYEF